MSGRNSDLTMSTTAFSQLVDEHYTPLYRFALSLARNQADAGDLVQQTFYIWATKGHALREVSKAKSWLFTTLYREFLRVRRREGRATSIENLPPSEQDVAAEEIDRARSLDADTVTLTTTDGDTNMTTEVTVEDTESTVITEIDPTTVSPSS